MAGLAAAAILCMPAWRELAMGEVSFSKMFRQSLAEGMAVYLCDSFLPMAAMSFRENPAERLLKRQIVSVMPFYGYALERRLEVFGEGGEGEGTASAQPPEDGVGSRDGSYAVTGDGTDAFSFGEMLRTENEAAMNAMMELQNGQGMQGGFFVPNELQQTVALEELTDYEAFVNRFYTIDANTMAGSGQLNVKLLSGKDMRIDRNVDGPQILIYHTHSQEGFADSVPGEESTSIMGAGEYLAEILTEKYGYRVMHHKGKYDVKSRDDAYSAALPEIEKILKENPSIQVVIDLHRDQMPESSRLVMDVGGRPTARFMFFNGLSRTKKTGNIPYLYNQNLEYNLAFSFQMQMKAESYYPGLARKIYLKSYRYNMHLCPKTLLIELGAQNNTLEEALNACGPIAHLLNMVLTGQP